MSLSTATNLVFLNSATRPGTITLPLTTTIPGRTLTLKDTTGAAAASTITVTTSGSDTFEDGTTTRTITTAFGTLSLTGSGGKWYTTATSQPTSLTVSTLSTQTLAVNSTIAKAITASTATISSLTAGVLTASTIQAPTISSLISLTSSLQANTVSSQTVTASNVQANFLSSLATQTSSLQANTISSQSILTSSIQANGFSSITLWASTINGFPIGAAFTGSTTYLSAAITNIQQALISSVSANTVTAPLVSSLALNISSINGTVYGSFIGSTTFLSTASGLISSATIQNLAATQGYVSSLVVDSFQLGSNAAFFNMGDVIATSLSTIQLNTGILYTNSTFIGSSSNQTAIQFYGLQGGYNNTALAEQSTGTGTQEFVVFRGSSASDRIRMQTTGNIVFETGVASRLWPNVASNVTPALIINTLSNVGIQTATPAFPLDVAGAARAQTLSSFALNVSSINGYIPVGAFTGSSVFLSSAQATLGTQVNISSIANFSTGNITLFSTPSVPAQFTITDTQLSTVSTTLSQILTKPTYQVASTTTYSYTGAYQTLTASTNWTHIFVQMWGAGGAGGLGSAALVGGGGAYVEGYIPVTAGESLTLLIGQGGQYNAAGVPQQTDAQGGGGGSGTNAGGGGGRTAIQRNSTDVVVAGGGGAASGTAGTGGGATWSGVAWSGGNFVRQTATYLTSNAGGGGQTVGGSSAIAAYNGIKAFGGTTVIASAGGGGAGWYGGGGSANANTGAGGGSSYTDFLLAAAGFDAAVSTPGFHLSPLRGSTGAGQGGAGIGAAGSNGLVYITPFTAVNNYKLLAFGTTLMPTMTSVDNVGAVRIWRDTIDPSWALDVGARSRFQYVEAATVSTLTLNTSNINVSSINGTVYGAFSGSTASLSAATIFVSSLAANALTTSTLQVNTAINMTTGNITNLSGEYFATPKYTTTFSPLMVSGCSLWMDAQDPYGNSTQPTNGTTLFSIKDKSASNHPLTSLGAIFNSTAINGLPGFNVATNQDDNRYIGFDPGSAQNNWQEVFIVAYWTGGGSTFPRYTGLFTTLNEQQFFVGDLGGAGWYGNNFGNTPFMNGVNTNTAFPAITSPFVARNNSGGGSSGSRGIRLGYDRGNAGRAWLGFIGEVICYGTALTNAQRLQVEGYLAWKWGINPSFSPIYTYYSTPPPPFGTVYLAAGSIAVDAGSNIVIQAAAATKLNLLGAVQATGAFAASTLSTSLLTSARINVSSISTNTLTSQTLSTLAFNVSSINGTVYGAFSGSTIFLSAATVQASTLSTLTLQVNTGYVSSLTVDSLQIGSNAAFISLGDSIATSLSTIIVRSGVVNASQLIASTISTTTLFTQSTLLGSSSLQTAIQFFGLSGNYTNTVLAEQSTSGTSQEFLVFRGSSASDRIRMQTTGNIVFEPGVTARMWPNTPSNVTPAMIINTASNIGILTATPAFPLDVAGIVRAQFMSTLNLQVCTINGAAPGTGSGGTTFVGSTIFLSSAQGFISSLTVNALTIGTTAGFTVMGDIIAASMSTVNLNVSTINGGLPGSGSSSAFNGSTISVSTLQLFDPALTFSSIGNLSVRSSLLLYNSTIVAGARQVQSQMFTF